MSLGSKIKQARKEAGLEKQVFLVGVLEKFGMTVSQQTISNWERDLNYPYILDIPKLAIALGKSLDWFFQDYTNTICYSKDISLPQSAKPVIDSFTEILPQMDMKEKLELLSLLVEDITKQNNSQGVDESLTDHEDEHLQLEREKLEEAKKQTELLAQVAVGMVHLDAGMKALKTEMKETKGHVLGMGENLQKTGDNLQYLYDMAQAEGTNRQPGIDISEKSRR